MTRSDSFQSHVSSAQLDIVLLKNPFELKEGDSLPIKVLCRGKPMAGVEVEGRDHDIVSTTDREGMATVRMTGGPQLISVDAKEPIKDDPDADYMSFTATLTFEVGK
jgi:hypothetical protein